MMKKLLDKLRASSLPSSANFVTKGNDNLASYRMRISTPVRLLNNSGEIKATISEHARPDADVNIFSKHFNQEEDQVAISLCDTEKWMDVCDSHWDDKHAPHYRYMIAKADEVTCNTATMQTKIYEETGRLAKIIPDPITFPYGEFRHSTEPKFLWFGHASNIFSIVPYFSKLPNLTVISNAKISNQPSHIKVIPWRPGIVEKLIPQYDIVLLPRNNDPWALTKSPNRAVDALHSGKAVWSDFSEVYGELSEFLLTGDLDSGIMAYLNDPEAIRIKVRQGQEYVKRKYSEEAVKDIWLKALQA